MLPAPNHDAMLRGVLLHALRYGDEGPRVVFCHGLFGQARNFATIAKRLSERFRVILLDMPNHGSSAWTDTIDYVQMADEVAGFIDREGPARVVGHSMGGKIAMLVALRHPRLVDKLVVEDMAPVSSSTISAFTRYTDAMANLDLATLESRQQAEKHMVRSVTDPLIARFLLQNLRRSGGWHWQLNLDVLARHLPDLGGWPDTTGMCYAGPVLWVVGQHSSYVNDHDEAAMRALFPATRRVTIKNAGHWVHSEQPEAFYQVVNQFLSSHL